MISVGLLFRYLCGSVFVSSLATVSLFVFVLLAGNALKEAFGLLADGRLSMALFARLMVLLVPYVIAYALPLGLLTGILLVLGRMAAHREIVAIRASGLSLWHIAAPIFFIATIGVVACALINCYYAPRAKANYRLLLADVIRSGPLKFMIPRTFVYDFPGYVIYLGAKDGDRLEDFWIWELDEEQRAVKLLRARSGEFSFDERDDALVLTLLNGVTELRISDPDDLQRVRPLGTFSRARLRLPLDRILGRRSRHVSISALDLGELRERLDVIEATLRAGRVQPDPENSGRLQAEGMRIRIQIQKNLAMAFSVLSLSFVAIPLGIRAGRSETHANFALALVLAMSFYFLIVAVNWIENYPRLRPDLLVWLPNLIYQGVGAYMLVKADRI